VQQEITMNFILVIAGIIVLPAKVLLWKQIDYLCCYPKWTNRGPANVGLQTELFRNISDLKNAGECCIAEL